MRLAELSVVIIEAVISNRTRELIHSCVDGLSDSADKDNAQFLASPAIFSYNNESRSLSINSTPVDMETVDKMKMKVDFHQGFLDDTDDKEVVFSAAQKYISMTEPDISKIIIVPHYVCMENGGASEWLKKRFSGGDAFTSAKDDIVPSEIKLSLKKWGAKVQLSLQSVKIKSDKLNQEDVLLIKVNMLHDIEDNKIENILSDGNKKLDEISNFLSALIEQDK